MNLNAKTSASLVAAGSLLLSGCEGYVPTTRQADGSNLNDATLPSMVLKANSVEHETVIAKGELQNIYLVPASNWTNWLAKFSNTHPANALWTLK